MNHQPIEVHRSQLTGLCTIRILVLNALNHSLVILAIVPPLYVTRSDMPPILNLDFVVRQYVLTFIFSLSTNQPTTRFGRDT